MGRRADLTICEGHNFSRVRHVMIKGKSAVWNGAPAKRTGVSLRFNAWLTSSSPQANFLRMTHGAVGRVRDEGRGGPN